jgi:hypothetical protein
MHNTLKLTGLMAFVFIALGSATSSPTKTPLELRIMQTRKFEKAPREIVDAIKTNCEDLGGTAIVTRPINLPDYSMSGNIPGKNQQVVNKDLSYNGTGHCQLPYQAGGVSAASFIPYIGGIIAMAELNEALKNASRIAFEIKTDLKMTETIVRMRIYSMQQKQLDDPKIYSEYFAKIGDAVHIQAIEITAATQE